MKNKSKWKMRDGTEIRVCDMDDRHILNTIAMLERNTPKYIEQAINKAMVMSCIVSGEMAQLDIDYNIRFLESGEADTGYFFPIYNELCDERNKRGLSCALNSSSL